MALLEELESQGNYLFKRRGTLPAYLLLVALLVHYFTAASGFEAWPWLDFVALGVCALGVVIRAMAVGISANRTSGRNTHGQQADVVNESGIYSLVRHPLYLGNFFMWFGLVLLMQNLWFAVAFIFIYWVYYERIMFAEEQYLRKKFGTTYTDWAARVPAFVPRFSGYVRGGGISLKKVFQREKNGIVAIFLVILLFKLVEAVAQTGFDWRVFYQQEAFWVRALSVSLVYYLVVKILTRTTHIFE